MKNRLKRSILSFKGLFWLFLCVFVPALPSYGQPGRWAVNKIPKELLEGSNAVIRLQSEECTRTGLGDAVVKNVRVITVLNARGNDHAHFQGYTDSFHSFRKFSGVIYDAAGKEVEKIARADMIYTEHSNNLAHDARSHLFQAEARGFPYTVKYEWEDWLTNCLPSYPPFFPVPGYNLAVEKSEYRLIVPKGDRFKYITLDGDLKPTVTETDTRTICEWKVENVPAVERESYSFDEYRMFPKVYITPYEFSFDRRQGSVENWHTLGEWYWGLMEGRDRLPEEIKQKVREMTAGASSDLEKVRISFNYLRESTRYVSIQLGVGGWQPMKAADVYKNGYGDCKALSNYMRMLLAAVDIESRYTIINMGSRDLVPQFATPFMANHAILQVPLPGDTLWLECTNPIYPPGYSHSSIAGQHGMVCSEGTARLQRVADYPDSMHLSVINATLKMNDDGSVKGNVRIADQMRRWEERLRFILVSKHNERLHAIKSEISIPYAEIANLAVSDRRERVPVAEISYDVSSPRIGSPTGNRMFVKSDFFRNMSSEHMTNPARRRTPVVVEEGYCDIDSVTVVLSGSYCVEALPEPMSVKNEFGEFDYKASAAGNTVTIYRRFLLRKGEYEKSEYPRFKEFIDAVNAHNNGSAMVLRSL